MTAAASACHWELKPFSQILLDDHSKSCSRRDSENGDRRMRQSASHHSGRETVKIKEESRAEEPEYKAMKY